MFHNCRLGCHGVALSWMRSWWTGSGTMRQRAETWQRQTVRRTPRRQPPERYTGIHFKWVDLESVGANLNVARSSDVRLWDLWNAPDASLSVWGYLTLTLVGNYLASSKRDVRSTAQCIQWNPLVTPVSIIDRIMTEDQSNHYLPVD